MEIPCPLCETPASQPYHQDHLRAYNRCATCQLVFVPPRFFLSAADEKAHYGHHQNSPHDMGYRKFLSRTFDPLCAKLSLHSHGLDFGSGPGPTLSVMLEEAGHTVDLFDPFFAPDESVFDQRFDFISATEVIEHLHHPKAELDRLWSCLRPGGWLAVMTKRVLNHHAFTTWHYKNDPTHVCFYKEETFHWLAEKWRAEVEFHGKDVVLIKKP